MYKRQTPGNLQESSTEGLIFSSVVNRREFSVEQVARQGENGPSDRLTLSIDWGPGQRPKVVLRGQVMSPPHAERHDPNRQGRDAQPEKPKVKPLIVDHLLDEPKGCAGTEYVQIWQYLAAASLKMSATELSRWLRVAGELVAPISFTNKLPPSACTTMQMTLPIQTEATWADSAPSAERQSSGARLDPEQVHRLQSLVSVRRVVVR